ncbi:hypothetical protein [Paenibacillus elgii]|uniref:hypothetical protein n=1 Tax=Paenibacillus elgii TaxID=189691 RepID=UPI000248C6D7|nr:hypothetical protein [Paenibacillus elgii]
MNSTEFEKRKSNLYHYLTNTEKWKENEFGELTYYKGKRNLKELRYLLELVFGGDMEIISEEFIRNYDEDIIGGSITLRIYVDADFNGWNQGSSGADVFMKFSLVENAYYSNQSSSLEGL